MHSWITKWASVGPRIALALAALLLAGTAQATTTLVINQLLPPGDPFNIKVLRPGAQAVQKATDGRVIISIPNAPVAAPTQLWSAVTSGIVDGAYIFNSLIPNQLPLEQISALPFIGGTAESTSVALWQTHQKYFAKAGEYKNVKLLALFCFPPGEIYSLGDPIVNAKDLDGRRLWALPGVPQQIFAHSKAAVISSPAVQVSELVAGRTVDAIAGIGDYNVHGFKVMGYMKSETQIPGGLTTPGFSLIVNRGKWESISPADRATIERLSGLAFAKRLSIVTQLNGQVHAEAEKAGVKMLSPEPSLMAELHKLAQPLVDRWLHAADARHVDGNAALKYFEAQARPQAQ